jgi:hypothetical protein
MPTHPATVRSRPRLAVEVITDRDTARVGLWIPGGIDPARVAAVITQALPGARAHPTDTTDWRFPTRVVGRELRPSAGPWTVLVAPTARGASSSAGQSGDESLRSVFTTLAESPRPAVLQLVITPARHTLAEHNGGGLGAGRVTIGTAAVFLAHAAAGVLVWALRAAMSLVRELMFATPGARHRPHATSDPAFNASGPLSRLGVASPATARGPGTGGQGSSRARDPVAAAWEREQAIKQGSRPLLHATLRVATITPSPTTRATGHRLASDIAIGYALALPRAQLRPHPTRRFDRALRRRRPGLGFYTTLAELGELWHLPAEPARYRLPDPAARNRPARPGIPRIPTQPRHPTRP